MSSQNESPLQHNGVDRPFFSIIIPMYNVEKYISECLASIVAQTFTDWEAVIVDDRSSDSSVSLAEKFSSMDSRIRLFRSENNSGSAYVPRLRAADLSRGKYIVTIDADDKVSSDLLDTHFHTINSCGADMVIPEMWRIEGNDSYKILPLDTIDADAIWTGSNLVIRTLRRWEIPMCGFAIRREIYLEAGRRLTLSDRKSIFADELLSRWLLFLCGKVAMCPARYFYRYNSSSVTNVDMPRLIDSRMRTADSLISMSVASFGTDTPTYMRAIENKFVKAIDLLRQITTTALTAEEKRGSVRRIGAAMKGFPFAKLRGRMSPRYLALMRLPMPMARIAMKIIDNFISWKNGI